MNKYNSFLTGIVGIVFIAVFVPKVFAACPWYNPLCTPTPTPSPTPIKFQIIDPLLKVNPGIIISTNTPTSSLTNTPTATPTNTPTNTLTPTITQMVSVSPIITDTQEDPNMNDETNQEAPVPTVTPAQPRTLVMGLTTRELAFAVLAVIVLGIVALQSNWTKIKSWLHDKTAS